MRNRRNKAGGYAGCLVFMVPIMCFFACWASIAVSLQDKSWQSTKQRECEYVVGNLRIPKENFDSQNIFTLEEIEMLNSLFAAEVSNSYMLKFPVENYPVRVLIFGNSREYRRPFLNYSFKYTGIVDVAQYTDQCKITERNPLGFNDYVVIWVSTWGRTTNDIKITTVHELGQAYGAYHGPHRIYNELGIDGTINYLELFAKYKKADVYYWVLLTKIALYSNCELLSKEDQILCFFIKDIIG